MTVTWQGVYPAVTTKFTPNDKLDLPTFGLNLDAQLAAGVSGLVLGGTLGEASTLTDAEKDTLVSFALEKAAGRVPVIINIPQCRCCCSARRTTRGRRPDDAPADAL